MLESPEMEQLRQRVIAGCHISPLDANETSAYIEHRLKHVGWQGDPRFEPDAYDAITETTGGIPRRINSVCDRLLLAGFLAEKHAFTRDDVIEAAGELRAETRGAASESSATSSSVNGSTARSVSEVLDMRPSDIDLSKIALDADTANRVAALLSGLQLGELEERLARLERTNAATTAVLRHLLDAVRARASTRKEKT